MPDISGVLLLPKFLLQFIDLIHRIQIVVVGLESVFLGFRDLLLDIIVGCLDLDLHVFGSLQDLRIQLESNLLIKSNIIISRQVSFSLSHLLLSVLPLLLLPVMTSLPH